MKSMITIESLHYSLEIWDSVFCMAMAVCICFNKGLAAWKRRGLLNMQILAVILLVMDACAWGFRGYPGKTGYFCVRVSNFFVFAIVDFLLLAFHSYVCQSIFAQAGNGTDDGREKIPGWSYLVYCMGIVGILLVIVTQFTGFYYYIDADHFCHRNTFYPVSLLIPAAGMALDLCLILKYRKRMRKEIWISMLFYIALSVAAEVAALFFEGISFVNIAVTISLFVMFMTAVMEQGRELAQKEKELYDMQVRILLSQISPHFIYNTLTTIKHLCKKDAALAAETVDEFSGYLRGNLDSLAENGTILFSRELMHVRHFVAIEQKRYGKRMRVLYDIQEECFMVPALTLQPIVENAVKHGIAKKEQGGTIRISTWKDDTDYWIRVADDGVGFRTDRKTKSKRTHVGIMNVTSRVKSMCGGTLTIESSFGEGTEVRIKIPQRREYGRENYAGTDC